MSHRNRQPAEKRHPNKEENRRTWCIPESLLSVENTLFLCKDNGKVELLQRNERKIFSVWERESINRTGRAHCVLLLVNVLLATLDWDPAKISSPNEFSPRQYTISVDAVGTGRLFSWESACGHNTAPRNRKTLCCRQIAHTMSQSPAWYTKKLLSTFDPFDFLIRQCSQRMGRQGQPGHVPQHMHSPVSIYVFKAFFSPQTSLLPVVFVIP